MPYYSIRFERKKRGLPPLEVDVEWAHEGVNNILILSYKAWLWSQRDNPKADEIKLTESELEEIYEIIIADEGTWEYPDDYPD